MEEMKKVIGFRLKNLRKSRGLKREGLAKIIGVSVSAVRDWEQGIHSIRPETLKRLAEIFEVKQSYFVEEELDLCNFTDQKKEKVLKGILEWVQRQKAELLELEKTLKTIISSKK